MLIGDDKMPFLDILYKLMEDKKIKKNPLCKKLDINTNSFVNWENRGTLPSAEVIIKLANYFDVSSDYLLGLDDVPNRSTPLPDDIQELIDLYSSLPERKQGEVKGFIKALIEPSRKTANDADNDIIETPKGRYKVAHAAAFGGGTMDILIPADVSYDEINRLIDENKALQRHRKNEKVADELIEKIKNKE